MLILIFRRCLFPLSIVGFITFFACAKNMNTNDALGWFSDHERELIELNNRILSVPAIKRIEPKIRIEFVPKFEEFNDADLSFYEQIKRDITDLGIKNVSVARRGNMASGDLISVRYTLSSQGISTAGGSALSIEYSNNQNYIKKLMETDNVVISTDRPGWYIVGFGD